MSAEEWIAGTRHDESDHAGSRIIDIAAGIAALEAREARERAEKLAAKAAETTPPGKATPDEQLEAALRASLRPDPPRHRLTASRIKLGARCLYWARPDVELPVRETSDAAKLGTALHEAAETEARADDLTLDDEARLRATLAAWATGEKVEADAKLAPLVAAWREWWSFTPHASFATEVTYALDVDTGRARKLATTGPRDYSQAGPREVAGTVDLVLYYDHVAACDYKTGRGPHTIDDHRDQLHYAAAVTGAAVAFVAHIQADGVYETGEPFTDFDRAVLVARLRAMLDELPTARPAPGLHCHELYCPALATCPATLAVLVSAEVPVEARRRLPIVGPVQSAVQARGILQAVPALEAWLAERVKAARAYADEHGGIPAPDGRVYRAREETRETPVLDVAGAEDALRAVLGSDADAAIVVERSVTWSAVEAAARRKMGRGEMVTIKGVKTAAREALRDVGAVKIGKFTKYGWQKAPKEDVGP